MPENRGQARKRNCRKLSERSEFNTAGILGQTFHPLVENAQIGRWNSPPFGGSLLSSVEGESDVRCDPPELGVSGMSRIQSLPLTAPYAGSISPLRSPSANNQETRVGSGKAVCPAARDSRRRSGLHYFWKVDCPTQEACLTAPFQGSIRSIVRCTTRNNRRTRLHFPDMICRPTLLHSFRSSPNLLATLP